jgi:hypothetical protein
MTAEFQVDWKSVALKNEILRFTQDDKKDFLQRLLNLELGTRNQEL